MPVTMTNEYCLKYKLDADSGEQWTVLKDTTSGYNDYFIVGRMTNFFADTIFGIPTLSKNILYYETIDTADTSTLYSRIMSETITKGIGITNYINLTLTWTGYNILGAIINGQIFGDTTGISSISIKEEKFLRDFYLYQNYPNPSNSITKIDFKIERAGKVNVAIYDVTGRIVKILTDEFLFPGRYSDVWDNTDINGKTVSSGIYYYMMKFEDSIECKRMLLLK